MLKNCGCGAGIRTLTDITSPRLSIVLSSQKPMLDKSNTAPVGQLSKTRPHPDVPQKKIDAPKGGKPLLRCWVYCQLPIKKQGFLVKNSKNVLKLTRILIEDTPSFKRRGFCYQHKYGLFEYLSESSYERISRTLLFYSK